MFNPNSSQIGNQQGIAIAHKFLAIAGIAALLPTVILAFSVASDSYQLPAMVAAVVSQIVGMVVGYQVIGGIIRQSANLNQTLQSINNGDLEARATAWTNDELGLAAHSLNTMCDNSLNLLQSSDDRDAVQASIESLIGEMKLIAAGDLTIRTEVSEDVTGAMAETVNHMTEQLRAIVQQVQLASEEVNTSAYQLREASAKMSGNSDEQASRITAASEQILSMTDSFQQVASMTKECEHVAVESRKATAQGLQTVSDTVDGMQRIRDQVQSTSKRIKRLGESSQEIGEIVQMISDIAERTSILALNASIQAAMAGDAGHGFAVVAEEIECLAERSTNATNQISKLIRAIQNETSEVISDMDESTREVVAGSELAAEAGQMLSEIDSISNELVGMIQNSSASALEQAVIASGIASSMSDIASSTRESAETNRAASQSFDQLSDLVSQLRNSVSQFKLSDSFANQYRYRKQLAQPVETTARESFVSPLAKANKISSKSVPSRQDNQSNEAMNRFEMPRVSPKQPTSDQSSSSTHIDILSEGSSSKTHVNVMSDKASSKTHINILGDGSEKRNEHNTHQMTVDVDKKPPSNEFDDELLQQVRDATAFLNRRQAKAEKNELRNRQTTKRRVQILTWIPPIARLTEPS